MPRAIASTWSHSVEWPLIVATGNPPPPTRLTMLQLHLDSFVCPVQTIAVSPAKSCSPPTPRLPHRQTHLVFSKFTG